VKPVWAVLFLAEGVAALAIGLFAAWLVVK
jgi:hypothetical protein